MRVVLPFKLVGQKLVKGRDFPKSVADGSKDSIVIKVDGIPDGCAAKGYFKLSWEGNTTYDLTFDGDELVVDEYIVTLPTHANNKYIDYKFSMSVTIWEGGVERLTTNPVEIVVEKSNYTDETTNTPEIPESQYDKLAQSVADVVDLANSVNEDVADHGRRIEELKEVDQTLLAKTAPIMATDDYAYAVCDNDGNVVLAITNEGEVKHIGSGGSTFDYTKCGLPVLYLEGDTTGMSKDKKDAKELKYTFGKYTGVCMVRWQGSSSVSRGYPKRNYTIEFDKNAAGEKTKETPGFEATTIWAQDDERVVNFNPDKPWGVQKKYCAKANWIDPSGARNVVCARLWAAIVADRAARYGSVPEKLVNAPNYGAVDGFPIIIVINDEFTGLYTFNIPKEDWMFNMGEGEAEYVVACESNNSYKYPSCRWTAHASFEGEEDYAIEVIPDDVDESVLIGSFNAAIDAMVEAGKQKEGWEDAVADYFDVDAAIDYMIFVCCIGARDNTLKNILYGTYDGRKWFMSAYDLDTTFGANVHSKGWYPVVNDRNQFAQAAGMHSVFNFIYKYSKGRLKARYAELRSTILSDENVWYMLNNFVSDIPRVIYNMDAERWCDKPDSTQYKKPMQATTTANVDNYMHYYRMHCAYLDKEIEAL